MTGNPAACAIIIFARAPVAGECKTRLIPVLGAEGAAQLQKAMTRHAVEVAMAAATGPVILCVTPDTTHPDLQSMAQNSGAQLHAQGEGDLGARMQAAFEMHGYPALLMGSDIPFITARDLRACAAALTDGADAVFLPAEDGGYGLVGLSRLAPHLFSDMVWSTSSVMDETRARLRAAAMRWREIAMVQDVDEPDDLMRLAASDYRFLLPSGKLPQA